jgi:hypothetical protein
LLATSVTPGSLSSLQGSNEASRKWQCRIFDVRLECIVYDAFARQHITGY